jgi:hypothetical protein
VIRTLGRLAAAAGLVVAGGLTLPGGAAEAAACSGSTGVTVVIDYGSSSSTLCALDSSSAIKVLTSVASVTYPPMYQGTVVCQINSVPAQPCQRMPPSSAYWAFFHASRGGSWTYSSSGVAEYDPAPGTVIGFAFGSGGAPSSAPPAPIASSTPKPSPSPSASSTPRPSSSASSTPRPTTPRSTTTGGTGGGSASGGASAGTPRSTSGATATGSTSPTGRTGAGVKGGTGSTKAKPKPSKVGATTSAGAATTTAGEPSPTTDDTAPQASAASEDTGSPTSLFAGLGLVGVVGAGAAYLAVRRRAHG